MRNVCLVSTWWYLVRFRKCGLAEGSMSLTWDLRGNAHYTSSLLAFDDVCSQFPIPLAVLATYWTASLPQ